MLANELKRILNDTVGSLNFELDIDSDPGESEIVPERTASVEQPISESQVSDRSSIWDHSQASELSWSTVSINTEANEEECFEDSRLGPLTSCQLILKDAAEVRPEDEVIFLFHDLM